MTINSSTSDIWEKTCEYLSGVLSKDVYDRWIALIDVRNIEGDTIYLTVPNDFYMQWLLDNYSSLIRSAIATVCGEQYQIHLAVDSKERDIPLEEEKLVEELQKQALLSKKNTKNSKISKKNLPLNPKYTFDTFVVGPSNNFSHAAALAVAQAPAKAYNPLFIYGGTGLGKTHLMQAIGHFAFDKNDKTQISYVTSEIFVNDYIANLQKGTLIDFRNRYRNMDILLIDDIQFLAGKERMQEEFFHTFNALFDARKQIVLTSDRPASEIQGLEQRLVSRFEWGLTTDLEMPDVETCVAILRRKQELLNVSLPDKLIFYMAERIRTNVRRLEGALIRAVSYRSLTGSELTIERLEYLLRDTLEQESDTEITVERIQEVVAKHYSLTAEDLQRKSRMRDVAFPRQIAMYLCRTLTDLSTTTIGKAFGRDHATVLYACRKVNEYLAEKKEVRDAIYSLNEQLKS